MAEEIHKTLATRDVNLTKKQRQSMLQSSMAFVLSELRGTGAEDTTIETLKELPNVSDVKCSVRSEQSAAEATPATSSTIAASEPEDIAEPLPVPPAQPTPPATFGSFRLILSCEEPFRHGKFNNFLKGCKWSPDGTCLLTTSEDRFARVFTLPSDLYSGKTSVGESDNLTMLSAARHGDLIYDYQWYPQMNSQAADSCVFVTASKDSPVHMWDAITGETRCTYRPKNHLDELALTYSLAFSLDGTRLYCGGNKVVRVFDVAVPGTKCDSRPTVTKGESGQPGIISSFAMDPSSDGVYAVGSYGRTVGLYSEEMFGAVWLFQGQSAGVTHMQFSPDGQRLYTGARKDAEILCWDMRQPGRVLMTLQRPSNTNQRIYFDQDSIGKFLVSGSCEGNVHLWDTTASTGPSETESTLEAVKVLSAHSSVVNGVSLNPVLPLLATASGQRVFARVDLDSSDEEEENVAAMDNSVKLWYIGETNTAE